MASIQHLFKVANSAINKADCACQKIWAALIFEGFESKDLPNISYTTGSSEIFLEWRGYELNEETIIELMESEGKITPNNFTIYRK